MKTANMEIETLIIRVTQSSKTRKLLTIIAVLGAALCLVFLVPQIQDALVSIIQSHIHRPVNSFQERLYSLFTLPLIGLIVCVIALCCLFSNSIAVFFENEKNEKTIIVVSGVITAALLLFIFSFSYVHGHQWLGGDNSAEMILGKLLADENKLVTESWNYSTELRLVYQTLFTMPLFKIIGGGNWALVRALNILLNMLVLIAAYIYMAVQMKIRNKWIAVTIPLLIMPVSMEYWDYVLFGGYYIFFIAQVFVCMGAFFALIHKENKPDSKIAFGIFSLFSLVLGIQGIRALMAIGIPLFIACLAAHISGITEHKKTPFFLGIFSLVLSGIGFFINNLLHFKYSFVSFDDMRFDILYDNLLQKVSECLYCLVQFFGLEQGQILFSARGVFGVTAIFFTVALFVKIFKFLKQTKKTTLNESNEPAARFSSLFFVSAVFFNAFLLVVTNDNVTARYFIPGLIFYLPLCALFLDRMENNAPALKRIAIFAFIVLFVCGQGYLNFQDETRRDRNKKREGYINYLEKNNITFGFAASHSQVTTELTNGKIEEVNGHEELYISQMLNKKSYSDPKNYPGPAYFLLERAEWEKYQTNGEAFTLRSPDYEDEYYVLLCYPSAESMYTEILRK